MLYYRFDIMDVLEWFKCEESMFFGYINISAKIGYDNSINVGPVTSILSGTVLYYDIRRNLS